MSGYELEKSRLRAHADQLDNYREAWNKYVHKPLLGTETTPDPLAFTGVGDEFSQVYVSILTEYTDYASAAEDALAKAAAGLIFTANTYGRAEEEIIEGLAKLENPETKTKSGSIRELLNP
ncbi:MAG: hypothetical protein ACRDOO_02680 [Actinomadura sp.]